MRRALEKITPSSARGDALLSALLVTALSCLLLAGGYSTRGNSGDILIPHISAQALDQGLSLHTQFHSVLGWMYHYLNLGLHRLIVHSHGLLKETYLTGLSSTAAGIVISLLYVAANAFAPGKERVHLIFLVTALTICLSPRWMNIWAYDVGSPNGMYSKHSIALLFIHAGICLQWYRALCKNASSLIPERSFQALCLLQAVILYIGFHYKITAFASSGCLALAIFFLIPTTPLKLRYALTIATPLLLMAGVTALAGYSYIGYLQDIAFASRAKASIGFSGDSVVWSAILFSLLCIWLPDNPQAPYKTLRVLFSFLLSSSFLFSVWSITGAPTGYAIAFAALCAYIVLAEATLPTALRRLRALPLTFIIFFCGLNVASGFYQATHAGNKTNVGDLAVTTLPGTEYLDLVDRFGLQNKPDDFYLMLSAQYVQEKEKSIIFPPYDDIQSWNAAAALLQKNGVSPADTVGMIGFANPFPSLLHTRLPAETWHWKHQPINLPQKDMPSVFAKEAKSTDVFYMPVWTPLASQTQSQVNCGFYEYNFSAPHPDFELFVVSPAFLLWGQRDFLSEKNIAPIRIQSATLKKIRATCASVMGEHSPAFNPPTGRMPYGELVSFFGLDKTASENFIKLAVTYNPRDQLWVSFDETDQKASSEDIAREISFLHIDWANVYIAGTDSPGDDHTPLKNKQLIVTPVVSSRGLAQTLDNCTLLTSADMDPEKFTLLKVTPYNLYWQKTSAGQQEKDRTARALIRSACQKE